MPDACAGCLLKRSVWLVLALLALPVSGQPAFGELRSSEVNLRDAVANGPGVALTVGGPGQPLAEGLLIEITGAVVDMETHTTRQDLVVAGTALTSPPEISHQRLVDVRGALRPHANSLELVGITHGELRASGDWTVRNAVGSVQAPDRALTGLPLPAADVDTALSLAASPGAELGMAGDFTLVVWEWSGRLDSNDGPVEITSGEQAGTLQDPSGSLPASSGTTLQQVILSVTNGTAQVRGLPAASRAYVTGADVAATGVVFHGVVGQLSDGDRLRPIQADQVAITGDLRLNLERVDGDELVAQLLSGVTAVTADGAPLAWVAPLPAEGRRWRFAWPVAFALLAVPPVLMTWRHRSVAARMDDVAFLVRSGQHQAASDLAKRLARHRGVGREATVAIVQSKLALGQWQDAEAILRRRPWTGADAGLWNYMLGVVYARGGQAEAVAHHVGRACELNPHLIARAQSEPALAPYRASLRPVASSPGAGR